MLLFYYPDTPDLAVLKENQDIPTIGKITQIQPLVGCRPVDFQHFLSRSVVQAHPIEGFGQFQLEEINEKR